MLVQQFPLQVPAFGERLRTQGILVDPGGTLIGKTSGRLDHTALSQIQRGIEFDGIHGIDVPDQIQIEAMKLCFRSGQALGIV